MKETRSMDTKAWQTVASKSAFITLGVLGGGFSLGFAPGWANGWPGLTMVAVWSTGMSVLFFTLIVSACSTVAAVVGLVLSKFNIGRRHGLAVYLICMAGCVVFGLYLSIRAFHHI